MARPRIELTEELQAAIVASIAGGNTRHDSAEAAGISRATFYRWLVRGKKAKRGKFRALLSAVKKAEAQSLLDDIAIIKQAAKKNWQAAAWHAERSRPEDWGLMKTEFARLKKVVAELEKERDERRKADILPGTTANEGAGTGDKPPPDDPHAQ